jgi:hypothetical protein
MATSGRALYPSSSIAAHMTLCVQLKSLMLRGDLEPPVTGAKRGRKLFPRLFSHKALSGERPLQDDIRDCPAPHLEF